LTKSLHPINVGVLGDYQGVTMSLADWSKVKLVKESAAMDQSEPKGAFGDTLARYYQQSESKTSVTSWPEQSTFAITRLHSEVGLPEVSQPIPEEAAIAVSIAVRPVPLRSYELYIDDRRI